MVNNFQRVGSVSNAHVGRAFETEARRFLESSERISLRRGYPVEVGVPGKEKKERKFDLGSGKPPVLVECKSHRWTTGGNVPSGKMHVWNEAMYYFYLAPAHYRKILFVLKDLNEKDESLADYYRRTYGHLIPEGVEIMEYEYAPEAD